MAPMNNESFDPYQRPQDPYANPRPIKNPMAEKKPGHWSDNLFEDAAKSVGLPDLNMSGVWGMGEADSFYDLGQDTTFAALRGVEGAAQGVWNLGAAIGDSVFGADIRWDDEDRVFGSSATTVGSFLENGVQFFVPFSLLGKAAKGAQLAERVGKLGAVGEYLAGSSLGAEIVQGAAKGAVIDFTAFDGLEGRLSDVLAGSPFDNALIQSLKSEEDDTELEGRFKNAMEGLALGAVTDGFMTVFKAQKAYNKALKQGFSRPEAARIAASILDDKALRKATNALAERSAKIDAINEGLEMSEKRYQRAMDDRTEGIEEAAKEALIEEVGSNTPDEAIVKTTINQLTRDTKARVGLSQEDKRALDIFTARVGKGLFDDINIEFRPESGPDGVDGAFAFAREAVLLFSDSIKNGRIKETIIHELWHSLQRHIRPETLVKLREQFKAERAAYLVNNAEAAQRFADIAAAETDEALNSAIQAVVDNGEYKFITIEEWWAATATDISLARIEKLKTVQDGGVRGLMAKSAIMWGDMVAGMKSRFGDDAANKMVTDFFNGRYSTSKAGVENLRRLGEQTGAAVAYSAKKIELSDARIKAIADTQAELDARGVDNPQERALAHQYPQELNRTASGNNAFPRATGHRTIDFVVDRSANGSSIAEAVINLATKQANDSRARATKDWLQRVGVDVTKLKDALDFVKTLQAKGEEFGKAQREANKAAGLKQAPVEEGISAQQKINDAYEEAKLNYDDDMLVMIADDQLMKEGKTQKEIDAMPRKARITRGVEVISELNRKLKQLDRAEKSAEAGTFEFTNESLRKEKDPEVFREALEMAEAANFNIPRDVASILYKRLSSGEFGIYDPKRISMLDKVSRGKVRGSGIGSMGSITVPFPVRQDDIDTIIKKLKFGDEVAEEGGTRAAGEGPAADGQPVQPVQPAEGTTQTTEGTTSLSENPDYIAERIKEAENDIARAEKLLIELQQRMKSALPVSRQLIEEDQKHLLDAIKRHRANRDELVNKLQQLQGRPAASMAITQEATEEQSTRVRLDRADTIATKEGGRRIRPDVIEDFLDPDGMTHIIAEYPDYAQSMDEALKNKPEGSRTGHRVVVRDGSGKPLVTLYMSDEFYPIYKKLEAEQKGAPSRSSVESALYDFLLEKNKLSDTRTRTQIETIDKKIDELSRAVEQDESMRKLDTFIASKEYEKRLAQMKEELSALVKQRLELTTRQLDTPDYGSIRPTEAMRAAQRQLNIARKAANKLVNDARQAYRQNKTGRGNQLTDLASKAEKKVKEAEAAYKKEAAAAAKQQSKGKGRGKKEKLTQDPTKVAKPSGPSTIGDQWAKRVKLYELYVTRLRDQLAGLSEYLKTGNLGKNWQRAENRIAFQKAGLLNKIEAAERRLKQVIADAQQAGYNEVGVRLPGTRAVSASADEQLGFTTPKPKKTRKRQKPKESETATTPQQQAAQQQETQKKKTTETVTKKVKKQEELKPEKSKPTLRTGQPKRYTLQSKATGYKKGVTLKTLPDAELASELERHRSNYRTISKAVKEITEELNNTKLGKRQRTKLENELREAQDDLLSVKNIGEKVKNEFNSRRAAAPAAGTTPPAAGATTSIRPKNNVTVDTVSPEFENLSIQDKINKILTRLEYVNFIERNDAELQNLFKQLDAPLVDELTGKPSNDGFTTFDSLSRDDQDLVEHLNFLVDSRLNEYSPLSAAEATPPAAGATPPAATGGAGRPPATPPSAPGAAGAAPEPEKGPAPAPRDDISDALETDSIDRDMLGKLVDWAFNNQREVKGIDPRKIGAQEALRRAMVQKGINVKNLNVGDFEDSLINELATQVDYALHREGSDAAKVIPLAEQAAAGKEAAEKVIGRKLDYADVINDENVREVAGYTGESELAYARRGQKNGKTLERILSEAIATRIVMGVVAQDFDKFLKSDVVAAIRAAGEDGPLSDQIVQEASARLRVLFELTKSDRMVSSGAGRLLGSRRIDANGNFKPKRISAEGSGAVVTTDLEATAREILSDNKDSLDAMIDGLGGRKKVEALLKKLAQAAETAAKSEAVIEPAALANIAKGIRKVGFWDLHNEYLINAMLSGTRTVTGVQTLSGMANAFYMPLERIVGGFAMGGGLTAESRAAMREGMDYFFGMIMASQDAFSAAMRSLRESRSVGFTDRTASQASMLGLSNKFRGRNITGENMRNYMLRDGAPSTVGQFVDPKGKIAEGITKFGDVAGAVINTPQRLIVAQDEFWKQVQYRGHMRAKVLRKLRETNIPPSEYGKHIDRVMDTMIGDQAFKNMDKLREEAAVEALKSRGFASIAEVPAKVRKQIRAEVEVAVTAKLNQFNAEMGLSGEELIGFANESMAKAREATFTSEAKFKWQKRIYQLAEEYPGIRIIAPFITTPINGALFVVNRTPLAPLVSMLSGAPGLLRKMKDIPAERASRFEQIQTRWLREFNSADPGLRADAIGRMTLGIGVFGAAYFAAQSGTISGRGPSDKKMRDALEATGWQPYSIKIGDTWYAYNRIEPAATMVGLMADLALNHEYNPDSIDADDQSSVALSGMLAAMANNLTNKTYLQGIERFMQALTDPSKHGSRFVAAAMTSYIPNLVGTVNAAYVDPTLRDTDTDVIGLIVDSMYNRVPGMSENLLPKRDIFGRERKRKEMAGPDLLIPIMKSDIISDVAYNEMVNLRVNFGAPSRYRESVDLSEIRLENGRNAYDQYQELVGTIKLNGKTIEQAINDLVNSGQYQRAAATTESDLIESPRALMLKGVLYRYRAAAFNDLRLKDKKLRDLFNEIDMQKQQAIGYGVVPTILQPQERRSGGFGG